MATIIWDGLNFIANEWSRPAWRADLKRHLLEDFMRTEYCQNTTVATFLESYEVVEDNLAGTLEAFHRRHIISWSNLRRVYLGWANRQYNTPGLPRNDLLLGHYVTLLSTVFGHIAVGRLDTSLGMIPPGPHRNNAIATALTGAVAELNSSRSNLFLGPGRINSAIGEDNDPGTDLPRSVITGKPHHTLLVSYAAVEHFLPA